MQTSETGSDTGSTVTLQTSVAGQAAVPTQVVQQVPVQQQVGGCYFCEDLKKKKKGRMVLYNVVKNLVLYQDC